MGAMVGNIDSSGNITLTSGTLASWVTTSGSDANGDITQIFAYGTEGSGNDWTSYLPAGATLSTITDSTHFKASAAPGGGAINGVKIVVSCQWLAATKQWWQNVNYSGAQPPNGVNPASLGAGYLGSDGEVSVDLRPAGAQAILWLNGDTSWATAAGQHQFLVQLPYSAFVHQTCSIQTINGANNPPGPHLDTDTMTFYTGGTAATQPVRLVPPAAPMTWAWTVSGVCINQYVLLISGYPIAIGGFNTIGYPAVWWISNPVTSGSATIPSNWTIQQIPVLNGVGWLGGLPIYDPGDGYLYSNTGRNGAASPVGPNSPGTGGPLQLYRVRYPKSDLNVGPSGVPSLLRPQFFSYDFATPQWVAYDPATGQSGASLFGSEKVGVPPYYGGIVDPSGFGFYTKASPGVGQYVWINDIAFVNQGFYNWSATQVGQLQTGGSHNGWNMFWDANSVESFGTGNSYNWQWHPEQRWNNWTTDDVCFSYQANSLNGAWPRFGRVTGL